MNQAHSSPAAELRRVSKKYGEITALDDVDLDLQAGEVTALLGPNGAGKTTAVRCLLGLSRPTDGSARVFGLDPLAPEGRQRTGVMLQVSGVPDTLTVRELVTLFSSYYPEPFGVDRTIEAAGASEFADQRFGTLSGGQKQRALFALAICGDPDLLLLDEPTVGLDVATRRAFWAQIRDLVSRGRTVLLTTHYLEEADALADRIVVIDHGSLLADGAPADIKARAATRRVRCRTTVTPDEARAVEGTRQARTDGAYLEVLTARAEPLLQDLFARDPELSDLEVGGAGLEDVFLSMTSGGVQ